MQKRRNKIKHLLVYGGSFDPLHLGHIKAIKLALKTLQPTLCFLTPAFRNPFKSSTTYPAHTRIKWIKRAIKNEIKDLRVKLCLFEIHYNKPTPTIWTIRHLKKQYNIEKITFLLGSDNSQSLHTWDNYKELSSLVEFVFLRREGYSTPKHYKTLPLSCNISSTEIRNGEKWEFLPKYLKLKIQSHSKT